MNMTETIHNTQTLVYDASCCKPTVNPASSIQKTVDIICRIALGIFAAAFAPIPFALSLGIGLLGGAIYAVTRLYQNLEMFPDGESKPVCAQGYMDFLSGMRFPPLIGTLATATFIAAHTRHDPLFYAPFCGLFIGFWLGREGAVQGRNLMNYSFQKVAPPPQKAACCCEN